jgi:2-amino-4-hydroxy-6-hydroxymethyldihydropteridine diphosphokinase
LKIAYLGLGSNLGNRLRNLEDAIERLCSSDVRVLRMSSIYETAPRDLTDQPWFLNQVIEAETSLFPRQLHARVKKIERELGRKPSRPKGPRLIDIDILLFGAAIISTPDLEIPHPRMAERRFVLEPLAELVPELRQPGARRTVREMLALVRDQAIRPLRQE